MNLTSRQNMAIAASFAALLIVAPLAFRTYEANRPAADRSIAVETPAKVAVPSPQPNASVPVAKPAERVASVQPAAPSSNFAAEKREGHVKKKAAASASADQLAAAPPPPPMAAVSPSPAPLDGRSALGYSAAARPLTANQRYYRAPAAGMAASTASSELAASYDDSSRASWSSEQDGRDKFDATPANPIKQVATDPVSTFSIDVDTASYSFVRRSLTNGHLPPKDAVRVEELINYFPYAYPASDSATTPFKPTITVVPSPWKPTNKLVHIGIKGYELKQAERPRANLVFLVDVSGSMEGADRLPLVKNSLKLLVEELKPDDTVGLVTYASNSGIALEPTKISDKQKILSAIDKLGAGGSTAGAAGIEDAYRLAEASFDKSAVNRIVLATDGDFNVGLSDTDQLKSYIERKRKSGIFLSILGVGVGNHNDQLMQALAQNGNGTAAYVDTLNEARKVLVDEASSTLFTIAKDVKIQVEWNPARVSEYRLIGYETRALKREDFNNDQVDAGDIGSGHTVTAIYEITPVGAPKAIDDLRYSKTQAATPTAAPETADNAELGFLKMRYKLPNEETSKLISQPIGSAEEKSSIAEATLDTRFSVAVAAFGDLLRETPYVAGYKFDDVVALAQGAKGEDPFGYRAEFVNLARLVKSARP